MRVPFGGTFDFDGLYLPNCGIEVLLHQVVEFSRNRCFALAPAGVFTSALAIHPVRRR
jgi:hypothetical protein